MSQPLRFGLVWCAAVAWGVGPVLGQVAPVPIIHDLPASVRVAGLAGAGVANIGYAGTVFENPSGLAPIRTLSMEAALAATSGHVAEGVTSCESVLALASSYDVEMPLTEAVHRVCHKGLSVDDAVALLLGRTTKSE